MRYRCSGPRTGSTFFFLSVDLFISQNERAAGIMQISYQYRPSIALISAGKLGLEIPRLLVRIEYGEGMMRVLCQYRLCNL